MGETAKHDAYLSMWLDIVEAFDKDATAIQFLRDDGDGGFRSGVYRMAREIDRLRLKCGEPPHRESDWQEREDEQVEAEINAELAALSKAKGA